jgi:iron-sulfur cluster assembly protein
MARPTLYSKSRHFYYMKIKENAIKRLKQMRPLSSVLRLSVVGGGCSGMSYKMEWLPDTCDSSGMEAFNVDELVYLVDKKSMLFLSNVELDYSEDINNFGFTWTNPAAKRTCGCGSSFSS